MSKNNLDSFKVAKNAHTLTRNIAVKTNSIQFDKYKEYHFVLANVSPHALKIT